MSRRGNEFAKSGSGSATLKTKAVRLLTASVLGGAVVVAGAPAAAADNPNPLAGLEKSIVFLQTDWSGFIQVPPSADAAGKGYWTDKLTYSVTCSGFYVSKSAQIVTAGHCVDPGHGREVIIDGYLRDQNAPNMTEQAYANWRVEGDEQGSPVGRAVRAVQPNGVDGATITSPITVEVVDFKAPDAGDVALLHVPNTSKETPGLVIAQNAPQVGDQITSIGFPGALQNIADQSQIARASFKTGTISSQQVTPSGVVRIEVNTEIGAGMSGGPTVNKAGQVVGVNSSGLTKEANFNFITNTADLRTFLQSHGVALVPPPAPAHRGIPTVLWPVVGAVVLVLALALGLLLLLRGRRRSQLAPVGGAGVAGYPMPGPVPMPGPMPGPVPIPGQGSVFGAPTAGIPGDVSRAWHPGEQATPLTPTQQGTPEETGAAQPAGVGAAQPLATTEPHFCASCGAEHHPTEKFCPNCGKQISAGESPHE